MTDQELKDLVASLAVSQAKTDEQMKRTSKELKESSKDFSKKLKESSKDFSKKLKESTEAFSQELKESNEAFSQELKESTEVFSQELKESNEAFSQELKESNESFSREIKESDERLDKELEKRRKLFDEDLKKSNDAFDKRMEKLEKKLNKIGALVGSASNNQGDVTEEYFANSLKSYLKLGNIDFDFLVQNFTAERGRKILAEYDILLVNGKSVAIVEVKYKAHVNDLDKLPKKIQELKALPQYRDYEVYAGIATFYANKELIKKAKEQGFFILQRKGDVVVSHIDNLQVA